MQTETRNSRKHSRSLKTHKPSARTKRTRHPRSRRKLRGKPAKHEVSAGGIIYRKRAGQIEIFFIKDPFGRWTFPKGHQEPGETLAETAVREIKEETNLDNLRLVAPLGRTSFRFKREEGLIEKTVYLFLFEAPLSAKAQVVGEGAIWEGTWLKAHKVFSISGYRNLDKILATAMRMITEQEGMKPEHPLQRVSRANARRRRPRRTPASNRR
jgi:8-oxo-dGTP pyrophosphatase MutT (NUDIX family)